MPATRQDLFRRLAELQIETRTVEHEPLFTVAESSKLERELPGAHTKNLFLKDEGGELFLIVAASTTRVDLKARTLRAGRFTFGKPELLMQALGVPPGSVTAFAVINDPERRVRLIVDAELMQHESINCHPLENTARPTLPATTFCGSSAPVGMN
jgi:Ala-tRNA(Pro) deacylase